MKGVQSSLPSTDLHWKTRGLCGVSERHLDWDGFVATRMVLYEPGRTSSYPTIAPDRGLRYHYLGGGNEVGNVGCILEDDGMNRLLLDYGLAPTSPPKYPHEAPAVTDTIITHSHIDHLGMAPWVVSRHRSKLHGTSLTGAISTPMWRDCHKVSSIEGYPLAWDLRDAEEAASAWEFHRFGEPLATWGLGTSIGTGRPYPRCGDGSHHHTISDDPVHGRLRFKEQHARGGCRT